MGDERAARTGAAVLASSPSELFRTAAGLPLLVTMLVLFLHASCCALQLACGSNILGEHDEADAVHEEQTSREAMLAALKLRSEETQLTG